MHLHCFGPRQVLAIHLLLITLPACAQQPEAPLQIFPLEYEGGLLGVGRKVEEVPTGAEDNMTGEKETGRRLMGRGLAVPDWDNKASAGNFPTLINLGYTAAAIGPDTILTAAHNVWDDTSGRIQHFLPKDFACCDVHPAWPDNRSADYALCRTQSPLDGRLKNYEIINISPAIEAEATYLTLTGYGGHCDCNNLVHDVTGELTWKTVKILSKFKGGNHYLEVESHLCPGDSGGPGFFKTNGQRVILGINSQRGCWLEGFANAQLSSTQAAKVWFKDWADGKAQGQSCGQNIPVEICGVNISRSEQLARHQTTGLCGLP